MKQNLKKVIIIGTLLFTLFLLDYNRVTSCGKGVYIHCHDYSEHYFGK